MLLMQKTCKVWLYVFSETDMKELSSDHIWEKEQTKMYIMHYLIGFPSRKSPPLNIKESVPYNLSSKSLVRHASSHRRMKCGDWDASSRQQFQREA